MFYNINDICMGCMHALDNADVCPNCQTEKNYRQTLPYLPVRTFIDKRYLVGKVIDHNGDGATYIGLDVEKKTPVMIREFLPEAISYRRDGEKELSVMSGNEADFLDCFQSFLELWRKLARLRGLSALQSVYDIIETNGTAYAISDYIEGITLRDYLLRSSAGYMAWEQARTLFMPVLSTLGNLHSAGIIHRGISPTTLLIGRDGKLIITGFSIWQARTAKGALNAQLFAGYAAIEQYGFEGQQGSWTDIYAFSAVLYRALIGSTPIDAPARVENDRLMIPAKFAEQLPAYVINSLINSLQILPEDRTRTVDYLRAELSASPVVAEAGKQVFNEEPSPVNGSVQAEPVSSPKPKPIQNKKKTPVNVIILIIMIAILALLAIASVLAITVFREELGLSSKDNNTEISTTDVPIIQEDSDYLLVPNFVGQTKESIEASSALNSNFSIEWKYENSATIPKGVVIAQNIATNTQVEKLDNIILTVSQGLATIEVPDVSSLPYEQAEEILSELGLVCIREEKYNDGTHEGNTVVETIPNKGATVLQGEEIIINVWKELETKIVAVSVPSFVGKSLSEIQTNAEWKEQFRFSFIYDYSNVVTRDYVISQSMPPNQMVDIPYDITLVISKGPSD